jgi:hypothetical protein
MALETALPTTPGSDCHVPSPTEGILAPVFNLKKRTAFAAISQQIKHSSLHAVFQLNELPSKSKRERSLL